MSYLQRFDFDKEDKMLDFSLALGQTNVSPVNKEKKYPFDYSHFNINSRCFGTHGIRPNYENATIYNVKLEKEYGNENFIKNTMPIIVTANSSTYRNDCAAGSAMAGISCIINENIINDFSDVEYTDGKITKCDELKEIFNSFTKYNRGYGQIVLQCNVEKDMQGLPEYAIKEFNAQAIEFKFSEASNCVPSQTLCEGGYKEAIQKQNMGYIVRPDPSTKEMEKKFNEGCCPNFYIYERLPLWDTKYLINRIKELKSLGLKNVYFRIAGCDPTDIETILRIASMIGVDMVTFDGANSDTTCDTYKNTVGCGLPTICLEVIVADIINKLEDEGMLIPTVTISGGIRDASHVFKALAIGEGRISHVGICESATEAAIIGNMIKEENISDEIKENIKNKNDCLSIIPDLRYIYGKEADNFSLGAISVFSYLSKLSFSLKRFAAINRKFDIELLDTSDVIPLTQDAKDLINGEWFDY